MTHAIMIYKSWEKAKYCRHRYCSSKLCLDCISHLGFTEIKNTRTKFQ